MQARFYSDTMFEYAKDIIEGIIPEVQTDPASLVITIPDTVTDAQYELITEAVRENSGDLFNH